MSARGRGRGGGPAKSTDRSSSSSSVASSRDSSLTRSTTTPTATANIEDDHRLLKHYTNKTGAGASTTPNIGASSRPAPKFTPNLSASKKEKDKTDPSTNIPLSSSTNDRLSQNRKDFFNSNRSQQSRGVHQNNRGGHSRGNFMQMEGIFQGNAQIPVTSSNSTSSSRFSSVKREPSASNVRMPNIKKLGTAKTVVIGDVDGLKYEIDEEYEPRRIPLAERKSIFDVKKEPTQKCPNASSSINSEHMNSFLKLFSQQKLETTTKTLVKDEPIEQTEHQEQTELPKQTEETISDSTQLILIQFPDVLPCTRTSSSTTTTKPELASLTDLPDGFLGKLQIYKSGKCRLKLSDDTYLDVDIGQPTSFLQNVMVTEMASSSSSTTTTANTLNDQGTSDMNKLVCLGDIKHKLIVSLDVDHMLQDTRQ